VQAVEIGYCIGRAFWNQGILTEALNALIAFFFDQVGANRIAAHHDTRNPASGKVMLKSGMKFEGVARQAVLNNQGIYDAVQYAILKSDWQGK
jgi:ribosomal-protein-alanine N-acetyltransferase